jgi:RNA polymerase sigma factor (sigma-70 family)
MSRFETTRWSLVVEARGAAGVAREALDTLCRAYRPPVLAYIRSRGGGDAAEDLTQAFFARFLEHASYADADPDRGRFRAFLLTAVKRFLANAGEEARTKKRGGDFRFESLDQDNDVVTGDQTPEQVFDRTWALTVLERALERMRDEAERGGKRELFEELRDFLIESPDEADYERVAKRLNLRRNTLAVAVHRMRQRLRDLVREELSETTRDREQLGCELRELRGALGSIMREETSRADGA